MARETEIKLKIADVRAFRRILKKLGARPVGGGTGRVHEANVIFDTPQGGLAKHGQLLRMRTETPDQQGPGRRKEPKRRVLVTFKRPIAKPATALEQAARAGYKVREELEVEVASAEKLKEIFEGLGMSGWFQYEKYRTTYRLPASKRWATGLLIELDETPIGTFVELEGPGAAIDRAASELGYAKRDYILKNYLVLYMEECRGKDQPPRNMLFAAQASPRQ